MDTPQMLGLMAPLLLAVIVGVYFVRSVMKWLIMALSLGAMAWLMVYLIS